MPGRLFDRVIVADWSANATPKLGPDSIWLAIHDADGSIDTVNLSTRVEAERFLGSLCTADDGPSTLLGVDFSLGYPAGTRDLWGLTEDRPWAAIWHELATTITDGPRNANNRFEVASELNRRNECGVGAGPFWGCPPARATPSLTTTKPDRGAGWPAQWRLTEVAMRQQGYRPFDCWQLLGAGSVGSQSLMGIPMLERLRVRWGERAEVWPFGRGLQRPETAPGSVVVAEVWPSMRPFDVEADAVRDQAQVIATAQWLARADEVGELAALFEPSIDAALVDVVVSEEGWVLGVGTTSSDRVAS